MPNTERALSHKAQSEERRRKPVKLRVKHGFSHVCRMSTISNNLPKRLSDVALGASGRTDTLTQALANSRRVLATLRPILEGTCRGTDWANPAHVRVTDKKIVLFVPNALQKTKLRQVLPRLEETLQKKGHVLPIEILVRPTRPLSLAIPRGTSPARVGSLIGADSLEKGAAKIRDTPLRQAVLQLAQTLRRTH